LRHVQAKQPIAIGVQEGGERLTMARFGTAQVLVNRASPGSHEAGASSPRSDVFVVHERHRPAAV